MTNERKILAQCINKHSLFVGEEKILHELIRAYSEYKNESLNIPGKFAMRQMKKWSILNERLSVERTLLYMSTKSFWFHIIRSNTYIYSHRFIFVDHSSHLKENCNGYMEYAFENKYLIAFSVFYLSW